MMEQEQSMVVLQSLEKAYASGGEAIKFRCFITKDNASTISQLSKIY